MTEKRIIKLVQSRGTINLMARYPGHSRAIATTALADNRPGHGRIK